MNTCTNLGRSTQKRARYSVLGTKNEASASAESKGKGNVENFYDTVLWMANNQWWILLPTAFEAFLIWVLFDSFSPRRDSMSRIKRFFTRLVMQKAKEHGKTMEAFSLLRPLLGSVSKEVTRPKRLQRL